MKIRQVWKLNQQYLSETLVFRSRRFSDVLAEVMRKTELRQSANEDAEMRRPKDQVDVPKCAEQLQNRCHLQKGPWDSEIQPLNMINILFEKWVAIFYYSTSTWCLFMQALPTQTTFFCSNLWKRGVDLGGFFLRSTAVFFAETNGRDRRDPLSLEKVMPPPWPPPNAVSWPVFRIFPDVNFWSNSQIKRKGIPCKYHLFANGFDGFLLSF